MSEAKGLGFTEREYRLAAQLGKPVVALLHAAPDNLPAGKADRDPDAWQQLQRFRGRSVHAIRWYESQGLIPGVLRDTGGRRVYNARHVGWLTLMERLRITGMSVAQMRRYTQLVVQGRSTLAERRRMLAAHREAVETRIAEYRRALRLIDRKIDFYDEWIASGRRPLDPMPAGKAD